MVVTGFQDNGQECSTSAIMFCLSSLMLFHKSNKIKLCSVVPLHICNSWVIKLTNQFCVNISHLCSWKVCVAPRKKMVIIVFENCNWKPYLISWASVPFLLRSYFQVHRKTTFYYLLLQPCKTCLSCFFFAKRSCIVLRLLDGKYDASLNSHSSWWEAVRKSFKKYASLSNLLLIKNA